MHIRRRGNRIVFIRAWWEKELKKTMRRQVASCPIHYVDMPGQVKATQNGTSGDYPADSVFTDSEMAQARAWFEDQAKTREEDRLKFVPGAAERNIRTLTSMIAERGSEAVAEGVAFDILEAIVALELELKRIGISKGRLKARNKA
jgi:hypothetical protein